MGEAHAGERARIDPAAARFERAWGAGERPRIEDELAGAEAGRRPTLLEELLRIERDLRATRGEAADPDEYRRRFPGDGAVIDVVFGPAPRGISPAPGGPPDAERNLLFAVIALQNHAIEQADLIAAFHSWSVDKSKPLGRVLVDRGAIAEEEHALVELLVGKHLRKHGGDARATLGAVAGAAARDVIRSIDDADVRNSLSSLPPAAGHVLIETLLPASESQRSRYQLTRIHADGGLGRVWLARDTDLNREVALKEILPDKAGHPEMWRRFLKEAQVTGQLEHPNIVPVYELGRRPQDDQPFYTMRFIRGQNLRRAIAEYHDRRKEGKVDPLELPKLLQAFVGVCQAIGYAHSRGVIHRDLKPDNIVLGAFGEVLVLDWGLAKMVGRPDEAEALASLSLTDDAETRETLAGQAVGTPAYMAPEQAEGRLDWIDDRTDIYGLGTILFEILTGHPPHRGQTVHELLYRAAEGETPRARSVESSVPPALDAICARAMAKVRPARYESAAALAEEVQRWLADEPVTAYREGLSRRLARWGRRNRVWVQAGTAALLLVAVVASASALAINAARRETSAALYSERLAKADAEENFQAARKAVQDYLTNVSENILLKQQDRADLRTLRKELLEGALRYYTGFIAKHAADPKLQVELADAYFRVAAITQEIGSKEEALRLYERSREIRERRAAANPSTIAYQAGLAASHLNAGVLQGETGRHAEALQSYRRSREIRERLAAVNPLATEYQSGLAATDYHIGNLLRATGRPEEAMRSYERARAIEEKLAAANPAVTEYQRNLAVSCRSIGDLQRGTGRRGDAMRSYERAREIEEKLAAANPSVAAYQRNLAVSCRSIGDLQRETGRRGDAMRSYERAREIEEKLAAANPSVTAYQRNLAVSYSSIGDLQSETGRWEEAMRSYELALATYKRLAAANPSVTQYQSRLATSLSKVGIAKTRRGRSVEGVSELRRAVMMMERLGTPSAYSLYDLACVQALLAEAVLAPGSGMTADEGRAMAHKAVTTLRRAVASGYKDSAHMSVDHDLDGLRSRPDFRLLMMDLSFPDDPFAR